MKYFLIFFTACSAFGQALPLPFINPATGGAKNFVVVQNVKSDTTSSISITPTAGNALVVFAASTSASTVTASDGVNSYTTITNGNVTGTQGIVAWAHSVSGSTVTVALTGAVNPAINVYEISGLTSVDAASQVASTSSPAATTLTTTASDLVIMYWCSETTDYAGTPTGTLSPGSLSGNLMLHDSSFYGAWFDWGAGAGISANTYTSSVGAPSGNAVMIGVAFK